ncbi:MAG TPA: DUF4131 domain-containing protein, partial [Desulfosarcina sp.]|nr:DUF4131 domain-containing protein [Desulfosarcina sp.]
MSANPPTADRLYFRPAIPVTLALMAGIVLGDKLPGGMLPALAVLAVAGARLAGRLARRGTAGWSPLLAVAAAGYLAMVPWASPRFGPNHLVHHIDDAFWQISGSVAEAPAARLGRTRVVLELDGLSRQKSQQPVHGRIRLTI